MNTTSALVTGGARGIGRAIVIALAARGDTVFVADLDGEEAGEVARALTDAGLDVHPLTVDVTDAEALAAAVAAVDAHAPLETMVNNAGIGFAGPLAGTSPEDFARLMAVNVAAAFFGIQAAAGVMRPRARGSIVNLSSTSGFAASGSPMVAYDTSKAAVRQLTASAARELAPAGIRVNAVAPGTIETGITLALTPDRADLDELVARRIPIGRLGTPEEIAEAVAWLASEAAAYVTGHTLVVDGGRLT